MSGPSDLYGACGALLTDAANAIATTSEGLQGYVAVVPGAPAFDCPESLMVYWTPINRTQTPPGLAGLDAMHRQSNVWINLVTFTIVSLRCAPMILDGEGFPSIAEVQAAAKRVADDAWALSHGITAKTIAGGLFGDYPCGEVVISPVQQLTESGGVVGCTMAVQTTLEGYP